MVDTDIILLWSITILSIGGVGIGYLAFRRLYRELRSLRCPSMVFIDNLPNPREQWETITNADVSKRTVYRYNTFADIHLMLYKKALGKAFDSLPRREALDVPISFEVVCKRKSFRVKYDPFYYYPGSRVTVNMLYDGSDVKDVLTLDDFDKLRDATIDVLVTNWR